jgi:AraC-like DNA-binding protein
MDILSHLIYFFFVAEHKTSFSRYLPVNAEALRWEIHCNDAGYTQVPPGADYPLTPRDHPREYAATVTTGRVLREFQVVYISTGSGWFEDGTAERRSIVAGDIFMLFPGIRHAYCPNPETGWHEYWVGFSGIHAERLFRKGIFEPTSPIHHIGLNQEIMADYEQIVRFCRQQTPGFQVRLGALVLQLLAHIRSSEMSLQTAHGDSELVQTARSVMQLRVHDGVDVGQIAAEIGVGYTRLLEIFRQYTGLTPYQYFLQLRIHRAKELLQEPHLSVKEISARMNFENQYYFSRLFKKKTGYSPTQWRAGFEDEQPPR